MKFKKSDIIQSKKTEKKYKICGVDQTKYVLQNMINNNLFSQDIHDVDAKAILINNNTTTNEPDKIKIGDKRIFVKDYTFQLNGCAVNEYVLKHSVIEIIGQALPVELYNIKYTTLKHEFIIPGEDLLEYTKPYESGEVEQSCKCQHKNKRKVQLVYSAYWFCPDCKADLGDA